MGSFNLGNLSSLRKDRGHAFRLGGESIVIFHHDGEWFAIENRCPHRDVPLDDGTVIAGEVICPLHGARFELRTGRHLNQPAERDLKSFSLTIVSDSLFVELGG